MARRTSTMGLAWDAWRAGRGGARGIAERQAARLDALVAHARTASPFYADHYRGVAERPAGIDGLRLLPPVRKSALMARFDEWVTDPAITRSGVEAFVADPANLGRDFLGRYVVFTTSGSTGVPALLVHDRRSIRVMTALAYVRSAPVMTPALLARTLARGARQAAVFATGGHFLSTTMFERRLRAAPWRRRIARYFSVLDPLPELVDGLNDFQPVLLGTYASALAALTEEQEAGRLRIAPLVITTGGELLLPVVRRRAEAAFGAIVLETYSASEASPLAMPCRRGRLHVNSDWFILEPIDAAGRPTPPGERSESVLVTNLANRVQPVIRYDLGDSVVMDGEPCECGSPLPTIAVEGRTDDILRLPRADGAEAVLLPMAVATAVEETPGVLRFQVMQTAPTTLAVRLETDPAADRAEVWQRVRHRLGELLLAHDAGTVGLELAAGDPRANPRSGKLRHVLGLPPPPL